MHLSRASAAEAASVRLPNALLLAYIDLMVSLRTVLHVLITLAVVAHGAWMAMMPLAHAMEAPASHGAIAAPMASSHEHHAGHQHPSHHQAEHHASHSHGTAHGDAHSDVADTVPAAQLDHAGDGHAPDHDMVGCECTLCKITSLAAIETRLALAGLPEASLAPRVDPAQQPRTTAGPPVGLRAPPVTI